MFKLKLIGLVVGVAVILTSGLTACTTEDLQALQGILKNADSLSGNVTVMLKDGTTTSFNLADIDLDGLQDNIGNISLDVGDNVTIDRDQRGEVKRMKVHNGEVDGIIKNLGTDNMTLTTEENGTITLKVTADTLIIEKARGTITLADLQVGQKVEARYNLTTMQVFKIKINYNNWGENGREYGKVEKGNREHEQNQVHEKNQEQKQNREPDDTD